MLEPTLSKYVYTIAQNIAIHLILMLIMTQTCILSQVVHTRLQDELT